MLDWVIVGGGIHGTYASNQILKAGRANPEKVLVIDPHDRPLAVWKRCTENTGMEFLRSPAEHNLDAGSGALKRFARERASGAAEFYSKYKRPSLRLFNAHCDHVVDSGNLSSMRHNASALSLSRKGKSYIVTTTEGEFESKRVILGIGMADCLSIPAWAKELHAVSPIVHVFSPDFAAAAAREWSKVVVVGGGISAMQVALSLSKKRPGQVTLLHSREFKIKQFDADPCWLGPKCLNLLAREANFVERRRRVDSARHWGSFPEDVRRQAHGAMISKTILFVENSVVSASGDSGSVRLTLEDQSLIEADLVVLATGFERCLPGGALVRQAIDEMNLPCAPCGFPVLDKYLRWSDGLFVTGALAELVIGPVSRNIIGARMASERIISADIPRPYRPRELSYYYYRSRRTG